MNKSNLRDLIANSSGVLTESKVADLAALALRLDADENAKAEAVAKAMLSNGRMTDLADDSDIELSFAEIEAMGEEAGMTLQQWVTRLDAFVVEAREELARLEGV